MDAADCKCEHDILSLGIWDGVNMGKGRVRTTTHPLCPVHALCLHYTKSARAARSNGRWLWCNVHGKGDCPARLEPQGNMGE